MVRLTLLTCELTVVEEEKMNLVDNLKGRKYWLLEEESKDGGTDDQNIQISSETSRL